MKDIVKSEMAKLVGNRIREFRLSKDISQEELAHRANMNTAHVGQIERGEKSATIDSLDKIVNAIGITFEELFKFDYKPVNLEEPVIDKIVSYLKVLTPEQQQDMYSTIKMLIRWRGRA